ncbi:MAG TPA: sulfatase-like hydrolase/transferase [Alphaproteobacteria bacterium]
MPTRPNFLLIITDQHRADHLSCYGNTIVKTPHIDSLSARGWTSDRFYVASPICMPNRATLMTGRMPSVHGVRHNGIPLSLSATTFTDLLRAAGYRTAMAGKSHLQNMIGGPAVAGAYGETGCGAAPPAELAEARKGVFDDGRYDQELAHKWQNEPDHDLTLPFYGFDKVALAIDHSDQVHGHYTRWLAAQHPKPESLRGKANALPADGYVLDQAWRTQMPEELYPTTYVADRTIDFLDEFAKTPDQPFFIKCSFPDPHHPWTPPGKYWDMFKPEDMELPPSWRAPDNRWPPHIAWLHAQRDAGKANKTTPALFACTEREAREALALNYGMITMIDDAVGRILARLEALGLADNTVVIFTSDHGDFMGDHQLLLKGPIHLQGLIRVPAIWADPAERKPGRRSTALAGTVDLAPTILDRAGLAPFNGMQGRSLLRLMRGDESGWREAMLVEEEGQRIYLGLPGRARVRTLITDRHRLTVYDGVEWGELYDLRDDPHEMSNLWFDPDRQDLVRDLLARLAREMIAHSETSPRPIGLA